MKVLEVTKEFSEQTTGVTIGCNQLGYNALNDGRIICSIDNLNIFPSIFKDYKIKIIDVTKNDLPEGVLLENIPHKTENNDIGFKRFDYGKLNDFDLKVDIIKSDWTKERILMECNFLYFINDELQEDKTKRVMLSVDNEFEVNGKPVHVLFKEQLDANVPLYPLTEQLLLARRDYIIANRL